MRVERCPKCSSQMQDGFVIDRGHANSAGIPVWASGSPEKTWYGGLKLRGRHRYRIQAWRCSRCGYLEWFALDSVG